MLRPYTNDMLGMKIQIVRDFPKVQLSDDNPVSDRFRHDFNTWSSAFFGTRCLVEDGQVLKTSNVCLMNNRTFVQLKKAAIEMERAKYGIRS